MSDWFLSCWFTLEIVDNYQYLGLKLKPPGSIQFAASELLAKANQAWFAISNVLYQQSHHYESGWYN